MKLKFQHQTRAVPASWSSTIKIKKRFKFEIDQKLGLARQQNLSRFPALKAPGHHLSTKAKHHRYQGSF